MAHPSLPERLSYLVPAFEYLEKLVANGRAEEYLGEDLTDEDHVFLETIFQQRVSGLAESQSRELLSGDETALWEYCQLDEVNPIWATLHGTLFGFLQFGLGTAY
jgi:hypothetical protein